MAIPNRDIITASTGPIIQIDPLAEQVAGKGWVQ